MIPAIVLTTIKIIGITLLAIISIILFLFLIILFVPVFYKADIDYLEELKLLGRIRILFGLISINADVSKQKTVIIKVLGLKIYKYDINEEIEKKSDNNSPEFKAEKLAEEEKQYRMSIEGNESEKVNKNFGSKLSDCFDNIIKKIKLKFKKIKKKINTIKYLLDDDSLIEAIKHIIKYLFRIIKHIRPSSKKSDIDLYFGMEDPSHTGYLVAMLSPFYPLYVKWLHINPNFLEKQFKINGKIRGHFLIGVLLWYFLKVYFNKNVKNIITKIMRVRGVNKNG